MKFYGPTEKEKKKLCSCLQVADHAILCFFLIAFVSRWDHVLFYFKSSLDDDEYLKEGMRLNLYNYASDNANPNETHA